MTLHRGPQPFRDLPPDEAAVAAERLEWRAQAPASQAMFDALVAPLLPTAGRVLEVGAGSAPLVRKALRANPTLHGYATDKSAAMLQVAAKLAAGEGLKAFEAAPWDVTDAAAFPLGNAPFDLIVSSVMMPYLTDDESEAVIHDLARRLTPGGWLVFVEQEARTQFVHFPRRDFPILQGLHRTGNKRTIGLGLRPLLRAAGLRLLPTASYLWTDTDYGPYVRDLMRRYGEDAERAGEITPTEHAEWRREIAALVAAGDYHYAMGYHRIAGQRPG